MTTGLLPGGWGLSARRCDTCRTAAALIYCRGDAAFLCGPCDSKLHDPTRTHPHERVWICEVCEQAPAAVTCKADAAALCATCDHDIHSANPLAGRHERVPVVPFIHSAADVASRPSAFLVSDGVAGVPPVVPVMEADVVNADAWLIPNPSTKVLMADFMCNDSDLLDYGYDSSNLNNFGESEKFESGNLAFADSVVPTQSKRTLSFSEATNRTFENSFDIDFSQPNKINKLNEHNHQIFSTFNYSAQPSISSSDVGVVPDTNATSASEVSYTFAKSTVGGDGVMTGATGAPATAMNREARVLRYREKRKNRKFEKTIRYASRKAYAETRPRIKGRFAKRSEPADCSELDQLYGFGGSGPTGFGLENSGFGVVPFYD